MNSRDVRRNAGSDRLLRLLSSFMDAAPNWHVSQLGFQRGQLVRVAGARWAISYVLDVQRKTAPPKQGFSFESSITMWPPIRARRNRQGWIPRLVRESWYRQCEREFARLGYRGKWHHGPWGRFGHFWRTLVGAHAVAEELSRLDRMQFQASAQPAFSLQDSRRRSFTPSLPAGSTRRIDLVDLLATVRGLRSKWRTDYLDFSKDARVTYGRMRWTVGFMLHVHRPSEPVLRAIINLSPSGRAARTRQGWHPQLLKQRWYVARTADLARDGYEGTWLAGPARYGLFGKPLKDAKAAVTELRRLARMPAIRTLGPIDHKR